MGRKNHTTFVPSTHGFHFRNGISIVPKFLRSIFDPAFGVCGGMCWAALDRYFAGEPIPSTTTTPLPGSPLYKELFWRQMDTTASWRWLKVVAWQNTSNKKLAELTRNELPKVIKSIDKGIPITLCLIQGRPITSFPTCNHQALAIGYRFDSSPTDIYLDIYDSNRPDKDTATLYMTGKGTNDSWKTYVPNTKDVEKLRGFFVIPYEGK